jgi:chaperonin cofactor prefoldin
MNNTYTDKISVKNDKLKFKLFSDDDTPIYKFNTTIFNKKSNLTVVTKLNIPSSSRSRNIPSTFRERTMDLYLNTYSTNRTLEKIRNTYEMRKKLLDKSATIVNSQIKKLHEKINKMQNSKPTSLPNRNAINKALNKEIGKYYSQTLRLINNSNIKIKN